jgi:uncharacterized RDD family membrane protein YckC
MMSVRPAVVPIDWRCIVCRGGSNPPVVGWQEAGAEPQGDRMSTPVPEFPDPAVHSTSFTFGGYADQPLGLAGVGFWPRVGARFIDWVLHMFISVAGGFFFGILLAAAAGGHIPPWILVKLRHTGVPGFMAGVLGSLAYHVIGASVHGSTLGKRLLSIVVVQEDGTPCKFGAALIRELGYFVDALFFGLIGYLSMQKSVKEQRHGDEWASTIVCKRSSVAPEHLRSEGRFVLALMLSMMADAALLLIGLLVVINS